MSSAYYTQVCSDNTVLIQAVTNVNTASYISSSAVFDNKTYKVTASNAITASNAVTAPLYVLKAGDSYGGNLDFGTGAQATFDNSAIGIIFKGTTGADVTMSCPDTKKFEIATGNSNVIFTGSNMQGTSSWAVTASFAMNGGGGGSNIGTGSTFPFTSSWAVNAVTASIIALTPFATLTTSSNGGITCSYGDNHEYVSIAVAQALSFTSSNAPGSNVISVVNLFLNNTANNTCSLSFPSSWQFIGIKPTYISSSKSAVLQLTNYGGLAETAGFAMVY